MRFYIASRQQETAKAMREAVVALGHSVTSRWIDDPQFGMNKSDPDAHCKQWAPLDEQDVRDADELILLTEPLTYSTGGRHTETGMAIALGKRVNIVGGPENVFHRGHRLAHNFPESGAFIRDLIGRYSGEAMRDLLGRSPDAVMGGMAIDLKCGPTGEDKLVVGIVGTASSGKSTLAQELVRRLGKGGYVAEVSAEYAREYKQRYGKIESPYEQLLILQEQLIREQSVCISTNADIVILEPPSFVSEIYAQLLLNTTEEFDANKGAVLMKQIRDLIVNAGVGCDLLFYVQPNWPFVKDGVRDDHEAMRGKIDDLIHAYLILNDLEFIEISSHDLDERVNTAMGHIANAIREQECGPKKFVSVADQMSQGHHELRQ